jgi:hypothetical protein
MTKKRNFMQFLLWVVPLQVTGATPLPECPEAILYLFSAYIHVILVFVRIGLIHFYANT